MVQESIPISAICEGRTLDGQPLRPINPAYVKALVASIAEIGLRTPISVRVHQRAAGTPFTVDGKQYEVIAGRHRVKAFIELGKTHIPAFLTDPSDLSDLDARLWEIDENLMRGDLTALERGQHLKERMVLYLLKHPETKTGGAPAKHGGKGGKNPKSGFLPEAPSFVDDTAEKTGMSRASVAQAVHRAKAIAGPVQEAIAAMPEIADKGVELDALAAVPPEAQKAAVEAVKTGKAKTVREATAATRKAPKAGAKPGLSQKDLQIRAADKMLAVLDTLEQQTGRRLAGVQITRNGEALRVAFSFVE